MGRPTRGRDKSAGHPAEDAGKSKVKADEGDKTAGASSQEASSPEAAVEATVMGAVTGSGDSDAEEFDSTGPAEAGEEARADKKDVREWEGCICFVCRKTCNSIRMPVQQIEARQVKAKDLLFVDGVAPLMAERRRGKKIPLPGLGRKPERDEDWVWRPRFSEVYPPDLLQFAGIVDHPYPEKVPYGEKGALITLTCVELVREIVKKRTNLTLAFVGIDKALKDLEAHNVKLARKRGENVEHTVLDGILGRPEERQGARHGERLTRPMRDAAREGRGGGPRRGGWGRG